MNNFTRTTASAKHAILAMIANPTMALQDKIDLTTDSADFFEQEAAALAHFPPCNPTLDSFFPSARARASQSAPSSSRSSPADRSPRHRSQPARESKSAAPTRRQSQQPHETTSTETSHDCQICKTNPRECVALPCGHVFCCTDCSAQLSRQCAICRRSVHSYQRLYFA